jgi:hypothetical protein
MIERMNPNCDLELNGGIDAETAPLGVRAGANVLVSGSAVFLDSEGVVSGMNRLRASVDCSTFSKPSNEALKGYPVCKSEWWVLEEWAPTWCDGF